MHSTPVPGRDDERPSSSSETEAASGRGTHRPVHCLNSFDVHPVLCQPDLSAFEIRHCPLDPLPEFWRVMRLKQVGQFMHDHVLGNARRRRMVFQWKYSQSPLPHEPSGSLGPAPSRPQAEPRCVPRSPAPLPQPNLGPGDIPLNQMGLDQVAAQHEAPT